VRRRIVGEGSKMGTHCKRVAAREAVESPAKRGIRDARRAAVYATPQRSERARARERETKQGTDLADDTNLTLGKATLRGRPCEHDTIAHRESSPASGSAPTIARARDDAAPAALQRVAAQQHLARRPARRLGEQANFAVRQVPIRFESQHLVRAQRTLRDKTAEISVAELSRGRQGKGGREGGREGECDARFESHVSHTVSHIV
jgi:hypothetical protein